MKKKTTGAALVCGICLFVYAMAALAEYDTETVRQVQETLNEAGFDCGTPDGIAGEKTRTALQAYQQQNNLEVTGEISEAVLEAMMIEVPDAEETSAEADDGVVSEDSDEAWMESAGEEKSFDIPEDVQAYIDSLNIEIPEAEVAFSLELVPNNLGKPVSSHTDYYDASGDVETTGDYYYEYDENGYVSANSISHEFVNDEFFSGFKEKTIYTRDEDGHILTTADYSYSGNPEQGEFARLTNYGYNVLDADGNILSRLYFFSDGDLNGSTITLLDENSLPVRREVFGFDFDETSPEEKLVQETWLLETDDEGRIIKATVTESTSSDNPAGSYETTEYDDKGRTVLEEAFREDNSPAERVEYTYTPDGYTKTRTEMDQSGTVSSRTVIEYNLDDNPLKESRYSSEDKLTSHTEHVYDEAGNRLEKTTYDENNEVTSHEVTEYDDEGRELSTSVYEGSNDEKLKRRTTYSY